MIFKTNKNGITIGGKTVDEISEDFDKLSNYISEKASKISSDLSAIQDKINSKNTPSTWSYDELPDSNISNLDKENYSIADKIREQNEYNELLKNENSSIETAIELSKRRAKNYDETLPKITEINNEYEKQHQLELEDKYNSTIKERNNEYDKYLSNLNTEVEESKKVQDSLENISPDTLEELGYKQKGYLKEIREEQHQFSDALTRIDTASVESLLPKKEDVKGYYDELLAEQREFQSQLDAIETTPIDSLKRDQYSEILSEQADGQMTLNLSATEYNDTLSTQNDLSNQRVLTLSEETDGQMALVMAENEGVSAKQKDITETTSQIAAKEALIEASNKELLSNVNEKLAKTGVTSVTEELTIAKLREVAASNEEGSALAKETLEMLGLGEASKATGIALKGLAMIGNMIAAWAIAEVLQLAIKGLDELSNSVDNCKERVDSLMSSYQTALDTANSNASRVEELASDYEKLSKGVNNLGENVSLTSEEYEQYNSLVSEIADMFPTLIQGYNDQGTAILNLKGNVEGLRDAYKEAQTEAYNTLIASGENGDGNDIIKQWEDVHDPGFFAGLFDFGAADVGGQISVSDALSQLEEIQKLTAEEYRNIENIVAGGSHKEIKSLTDIQKEIGYGSYIGKALGIDGNVTDKEFEEAKKQAKVLVQTYNAEIESALSDIETLANAYLMTNDDYSKLTDSSKTAASLLVNNLTEDIASDFSSKEDVGSWVDSVVSKLQNNLTLSNAINGLFTTDLSNMSVDEAKAVVDQYINTIAKILEEDPVDVKVRLGFDDYNDDDIAPLKTKVQGFLKDEFDDKVGELSLDDLQIASKLEIPDGTLLSWDELKQKIEEAKNATSEETPISPTSFEDAWTALDSTDKDEIKTLKKDLLEAAEAGQLSAEKFNELDKTEYFKNLGISADSAIRKINSLVNASTQLSSMSTQISKMSDMLADKKNGTVASASDLAGFDVSVRGLESWDQFERVMGDSTSTMDQCQKAANALATEWVNDGNFLSNLTDENKKYYITQLEDMGIKNAEQIVTDALTKKEEELRFEKLLSADASTDLQNATVADILKLQNLGDITEQERAKLAAFTLEKQYCNKNTIVTDADCQNIYTLAKMAGAGTEALNKLAALKQRLSDNPIMSNEMRNNINSAIQDIVDGVTTSAGAKLDIPQVKVNSSGSSSYKAPSSKKSKSKSKTKSDAAEVFDFIEIKLNNLTDKASKAKDKIDDLLTFGQKKNQTKKAIEATTKAITAQEKAYKKYMAYANKAAKTQNSKKTSSSSSTSTGGNAVYDTATDYLGLKYVWGGASLTKGADCSGFTQQIYKKYGVSLPHHAADQAKMGTKITSKKDLQAGDLVFFGSKNNITHVGIYGGDGKFIESPHTGASVKVSKLSSRKDFVSGSRFSKINSATSTSSSSGKNVKKVKGVSSKTLEHYKKLIREGTLDGTGIASIKNENLKNALKDYQTYYEKAKACKERVASLTDQLKDLYETLANNPIDNASDKIEKLGTKMDIMNAKVSNLTFDPTKKIGTSDIDGLYKQIIKNYDSQLSASKTAYTDATKSYNSNKSSLTKSLNRTKAKNIGLTQKEFNSIKSNLKSNKSISYNIINKIENDRLREKCIAHNEYLLAKNTATDNYNQAKEDHTSNVRQARKDRFDKVQARYDNKAGLIEQKKNAVSNFLSIAEAKGQLIGDAYYTRQADAVKSDMQLKQEEAEKLAKKLSTIKFGSDEWYEAQEALNGVYESIQQDEQELAEFQKSINQLKFDRFDELLNKLGDITDETDFLIDMLDSDNLFDSDTGMISQDGITAMGLTAQNYDTYLAKAQEYKDAIADLDEMYKEGKIGLTDYNSQLRTYQQGQRDSIKSANEAKKSLVSYVKQGLDAQNSALEEAISKKKELLETEKD